MGDVMLPWPRPRRSGADGSRPAPAAPHYEIQRVNADGSTGPVEVLPITSPPWSASSGRRGFLGAGIASSVVAALLLSGCDDEGAGDAPTPSDSPSTPDSDVPDDTPTPDTPTPDTPSFDTSIPGYQPPSDTPTYDAPSYDPPTYQPTYGGSGGVICTCNKVCTCIPVCQAHRLLDQDPVVRRMAETVVLAMGRRELRYLRWAAGEAEPPLRARVLELVEQVRDGRRPAPGELAARDCEPYLASDDPVTALMAAQVLTLRALSLGTGLGGARAERAARALTAGHALHRDRAHAWSR